ncbi:MAG: CBS domain-containing protein [Calothrix sp. C42_A2020_038]|nr:CBS domain-containing protein [Calothrix sp. C42_A2020_038]
MLEYPLDEFIINAPICLQTTTLADVLSIFDSENCERIVVVSEVGYPIGILNLVHLLPQLASVAQGKNVKNLQKQLFRLNDDLIKTAHIVSVSANIQEFSQVVYSLDNGDGIVITDADGKYLGLVDNQRLLKYLNKLLVNKTLDRSKASKKHSWQQGNKNNQVKPPTNVVNSSLGNKSQQYQSLVKLLEHLPWPLMLQTSSGDVVTQNPAWWQQLGILKDPEGVRQEVESILFAPVFRTKPNTETNIASDNNQLVSNRSNKRRGKSVKSSRCVLDNQLGTCTCVVEVQSGQERVWQFAKIPLDSADKVLEEVQDVSQKQVSSTSGVTGYLAKEAKSENAITSQRQATSLIEDQFQSVQAHNSDLWLMLATDVTEQQQLSKELAAKNADLIQLNRLKDEFLACISHELKTPLTAVLGLSRLLIDQQLGELNERQARYAGLIHQSGRHLMSVVNDILDLTRMETGQMELLLGTVKIKAVCEQALTESKAVHASTNKTQSDKNHEFTLTIEPGLDEIIADEQRLRQMLVHLLSNAFKFTEGGGKVGLRVNRWEGWIAFTVWDTGIGIPEHQQHLIFQKFQQLENPLTRQFEGTGLGLVLTRALARLHGGDVSFLSREGKGSQFTLLLPPSPPKGSFTENSLDPHGRRELATEKSTKNNVSNPGQRSSYTMRQSFLNAVPSLSANGLEASNTTGLHGSQRLILLVEAVGRYIEELTEHLTGMGYRVAIARSGCEAVEKARRLQPKAIFLNPLLPLLSGWDVLTLLKSEEATRHIPVIVTATVAEKEQAFANRADGFLRLPVQHQMLAPLLDSLSVTPEVKKQIGENSDLNTSNNPLRILRLVNHNIVNNQPSLPNHRVIEVDDIEQAELLARVWQFDVMLLDAPIEIAKTYLNTISQHPRLSTLPLVTCNVEVSQIASQIAGLSVFPCLTPLGSENNTAYNINTLLSVLQIAAGISCPPSILVVDLAILPDLPETRNVHLRNHRVEKHSVNLNASTKESFRGLDLSTAVRSSEWMQALIQYLQTGGFKAAPCRSWSELLQQIRHHSIDLLLICLAESAPEKEVFSTLKALEKLPFNLPPVLILDRRLNVSIPGENLLPLQRSTRTSTKSIAKTLPRSISMEDLLHEIHAILKG